jgi:hypothetical protein
VLRPLNRGAKALERAVQMESRLELQLALQLEQPRREPGVAWWAQDRGFRCGISAAPVGTARGSSGLSQV